MKKLLILFLTLASMSSFAKTSSTLKVRSSPGTFVFAPGKKGSTFTKDYLRFSGSYEYNKKRYFFTGRCIWKTDPNYSRCALAGTVLSTDSSDSLEVYIHPVFKFTHLADIGKVILTLSDSIILIVI